MIGFLNSNEFKTLADKEQQNIVAFIISMEKRENTMDFDGHITLPSIEKRLKELVH